MQGEGTWTPQLHPTDPPPATTGSQHPWTCFWHFQKQVSHGSVFCLLHASRTLSTTCILSQFYSKSLVFY